MPKAKKSSDKDSNPKEEKKEDSKARSWVMTVHLEGRPEADVAAKIRNLPDWVKYIRFGREVCPTTQRVHFQAWVQCYENTRFSRFKSWVGNAFREPMYGTMVDNQTYTSKEGQYEDIGTAPMQGRRTDILGTKRALDALEPGVNVWDLAREEPHFATVLRNSRAMESYLANKRFRDAQTDFSKPTVIYINGPPGSGKDKYVDEHYPGHYDCPASSGYKWKNGYNMDVFVKYGNLTPESIKDNKIQFLKELDRRVIQVETKGGFVPWKPKCIIITSIFSLIQMATIFDDPLEFTRRITNYKRWSPLTDSFVDVDLTHP